MTTQYDVSVSKLMDTLVNALYSEKDKAFRELISNANDAIDKLITVYDNYPNLKPIADLKITISATKSQIIIEDDGIGMTENDIRNYLGTISKSGTQEFRQSLNNENFDKSANFIGQFGVGFYSGFLIADKVTVITKHPSSDTFVFNGNVHGYSIEKSDVEIQNHGTKVILHVKEGAESFCELGKIEEIVKKYSSFVSNPIYILKPKKKPSKEESKEGLKEGAKEEDKEQEGDEAKEEDKEEDTQIDDNTNTNDTTNDTNDIDTTKDDTNDVDDVPKISQKTSPPPTEEYEAVKINTEKPIWSLKPSEVTKDQHSAFYKQISADWDDYRAVHHVNLEGGVINFTFLLYLPKKNRQSPFTIQTEKKKNVKMYVSNVFVTTDLSEAIPDHLNFVHGIIASNDIPMNVSREICQGTNTIKILKNNFPKHVLKLFESLQSSDDYLEILNEYSSNLKIHINSCSGSIQKKFADLLRYKSTKHDGLISLEKYCESNPKQIYVLTGSSEQEMRKSPLLKIFHDEDVLLMDDPCDEILLQQFTSYNNIPIKKIDTLEVLRNKRSADYDEDEYKPFVEKLKKCLDQYVDNIFLKDLGGEPCLITQSAYGYSPMMESMMNAQVDSKKNFMYSFMKKAKKSLTIDPKHFIIQGLKEMVDSNKDWEKYAHLLYETSLIQRGYTVEDTDTFANRIYQTLGYALNKEQSVGVEEIVESQPVNDAIENTNE